MFKKEEVDLVGCNWEPCLISIVAVAIFRHAGYYRAFLIVLVSALAFEAGDFVAFA